MDPSIVVAVFWLLSGEPAYDIMPADQCEAVEQLRAAMADGQVVLELADGTQLTASKVECKPVRLVIEEAAKR